MISEILIYELTIEKSEIKEYTFLKFFKFKRKEDEIEKYILTYRLDEDRFWFYKKVNGKQVDDHLMKQNLENSLNTFYNIQNRFKKCNGLIKNKCNISIFSLKVENPKLYDLIHEFSDSKEDYYERKKGGFLLNNDINF